MPKHKIRKLTGGVLPTSPPLDALTGGRPAKRDRVASVFAEQDRLLGHGRRIVAAGGMQGSTSYRITSVDALSNVPIYPEIGFELRVHRGRVNVTPGHYLVFNALCGPAGPTQGEFDMGDGVYLQDSIGGQIKVAITYDNGVDTLDPLVQTPGTMNSSDTYGAESMEPGGYFGQLHQIRAGFKIPGTDTIGPDAAAKAAAWSENVTAEIEVSYINSPRVADWIIYEVPFQYARSFEDPAPWSSSLYTNGQGQPLTKYPSAWPVSHTNTGGDPSNGYTFALATASRQTSALGPYLISQSTYDEGHQPLSQGTPPPLTTASTTYVDLWRPAITSWGADKAGWSLSSGGNAPQWGTSGPHLELRDKARVVPVRVSVYARVLGGGTGRLRLMASDYSCAEILVNSSSYQWFETDAHLLCGFGAEDTSNAILFGKVSAGGTTLSVQYFQVQHIDA